MGFIFVIHAGQEQREKFPLLCLLLVFSPASCSWQMRKRGLGGENQQLHGRGDLAWLGGGWINM